VLAPSPDLELVLRVCLLIREHQVSSPCWANQPARRGLGSSVDRLASRLQPDRSDRPGTHPRSCSCSPGRAVAVFAAARQAPLGVVPAWFTAVGAGRRGCGGAAGGAVCRVPNQAGSRRGGVSVAPAVQGGGSRSDAGWQRRRLFRRLRRLWLGQGGGPGRRCSARSVRCWGHRPWQRRRSCRL